uniref:Reverse transcriptase zinc-binding domain-containing protein n=1 Tax=Oryza glaberrima TaxID=4538 RepID=I1QFN6_ORYGL
MSTMPLNISFRRAIVGQKLIKWNDLILRLANITLSNEKDDFVWSLHKNGQFSVKSMYAAIMNCNVRIKKRILWDLEIPLKIKVFMWFLHKKVIFMSSYWLHFWSTMLPQEEQDTMRNGATLLESVAKGLLFHYG